MNLVRKIVTIVVALLLFIFGTIIILYSSYLKPFSNSNEEKIVEIQKGVSSREIANILYENKLIKNKDFFLIYLKINDIKNLQAGKYKLKPNLSLKEIVLKIQNGDVFKESFNLTFQEGINYREVAKIISENTNNTYQMVMDILNDTNYIDSLINDYWFITEKIKNPDIYYSLEGYLFPDTYEFKDKDVTIKEIFKKMLDKMNDVLTPYKDTIEKDTFSIHELLTLSSIAEKEVNNKNNLDNRKNVISVFINRINKKISLGSDITTRYGLKLDEIRPLTKSEYNSNNAYNTRNINMLGLPVSPICMVSKESIEASIERINTDYLYFIANINTGETFFYENSQDFEKKKSELSKVNGGY